MFCGVFRFADDRWDTYFPGNWCGSKWMPSRHVLPGMSNILPFPNRGPHHTQSGEHSAQGAIGRQFPAGGLPGSFFHTPEDWHSTDSWTPAWCDWQWWRNILGGSWGKSTGLFAENRSIPYRVYWDSQGSTPVPILDILPPGCVFSFVKIHLVDFILVLLVVKLQRRQTKTAKHSGNHLIQVLVAPIKAV